jgi:hypothetical protein
VPPLTRIRLKDTHRLIPSRYPAAGILDAVASAEDLELMFELEGWTKDRISAELGILTIIPRSEWVVGRRMASVIMAAFCHPRQEGSRFSGPECGAWYAARSLATAHRETLYHRTAELAEVGVFESRLEMRLYLADFNSTFHDIRADQAENDAYHNPASYEASQALGRQLLALGSNGILYRSVRHAGGECIACFRPPLVRNVRAAGHFEYSWSGGKEPAIRPLG